MTSVIGYADMLYQREFSRQEIKDAAWYIMNEGMRLEALSLKLMDLFVLGRNEILLEEMSAEEVLENCPENQWLLAHCMEYGFILSYLRGKEGITGIDYEPWHLRYVGREAAQYLTEKGLTLEEFWETF